MNASQGGINNRGAWIWSCIPDPRVPSQDMFPVFIISKSSYLLKVPKLTEILKLQAEALAELRCTWSSFEID